MGEKFQKVQYDSPTIKHKEYTLTFKKYCSTLLKIAARSDEGHALDNLTNMILTVRSVHSYLMMKKYSSFPQLRNEANFIVYLRCFDRNIRNCTEGVPLNVWAFMSSEWHNRIV